MAVTWSYGGSSSVSVTLDTITSHSYVLVVVDGATQHLDSFTGTGSPMTRTITGLSGLSAGDRFGGEVEDATNQTILDSQTFLYGTASSGGADIAGTWSYDGAETFSFTFTGLGGVSYYLQVDYYGSPGGEEYGSPFTGTGSSQVESLTISGPPVNDFEVSIWLNQGTFTQQASTLFTAGGGSSGGLHIGLLAAGFRSS